MIPTHSEAATGSVFQQPWLSTLPISGSSIPSIVSAFLLRLQKLQAPRLMWMHVTEENYSRTNGDVLDAKWDGTAMKMILFPDSYLPWLHDLFQCLLIYVFSIDFLEKMFSDAFLGRNVSVDETP